jgi:hypothetical protein
MQRAYRLVLFVPRIGRGGVQATQIDDRRACLRPIGAFLTDPAALEITARYMQSQGGMLIFDLRAKSGVLAGSVLCKLLLNPISSECNS